MSTYYRYTYKKGISYTCPSCGVPKKFTRYVDQETMELLPEKYGKCNRVENCGYFLNPYKDGYSNGTSLSPGTTPTNGQKKLEVKPKPFFIPNEILENTIGHYDLNLFVQNLKQTIPYPFPSEEVDNACCLYRIGTIANGYMKGGTTFPFIDERANVRFIQVKLFNSLNHTTQTDSLPSMIERQYLSKTGNIPPWPARNPPMPRWLQDYSLNELKISCLFGAHLLSLFPKNPIALVEAPKTAIYGTLYFGLPSGPKDLLWLAVYSRDTLTAVKCMALMGRKVYLFPDLSRDGSTYEKWQNQAKEIQKQVPGLRIVVSDFLENIANQKSRNNGEDLADLLSQFDWRLFRNMNSTYQCSEEKVLSPEFVTPEADQKVCKSEQGKSQIQHSVDEKKTNQPAMKPDSYWHTQFGFIPGSWDLELFELEQYFTEIIESGKFPAGPIKIGNHPPINNIPGFIRMNLETAKGQSGNPTYKPYFERLIQLREYLIMAEAKQHSNMGHIYTGHTQIAK